MEKNIKEAISIIEDVRKSMPECANKSFLKGAINELNEVLSMQDAMQYGLSEVEFAERERLLELQKSRTRWFSQQEFDRLKELSNKMFANAGSPNSAT